MLPTLLYRENLSHGLFLAGFFWSGTQALTLYLIHNRLCIKIYCKWVAAVSAFDENQDIVPSMRLFNFLLAG